MRRPSGLPGLGFLTLVFLLVAAVAGSAAKQRTDIRPEKFVGPNACAECHKDETTVWKGTHHFSTFRDMPRNKNARKISSRLKIRRIKSESLCLGCHFTQAKNKSSNEVIAGISCESCHGAGEDWINLHSEFSGKKKKELESKAEATARWKKSESLGMIRPATLYRLARNCYGCHVVPNEKLVNVGQHPAGSSFELVSWSQGEIRHNLWYSKGKSNPVADLKRKRLMYLVGIAVEIETALNAIGKATKKKEYAIRMAHRADRARKKMAAASRAIKDVPELRNIVKLSHSAGLKLKNKKALSAAADQIANEALRLLSNYDGSSFGAIDKMIPGPEEYRGKPAK